MALHGTTTVQQILAQSRSDSLAEAALWLTQELNPGVDIDHYLERLYFYAESISERMPDRVPLGDVLFHLNDYLFNDRGFHTDCDGRCPPEGNFIHRVIDLRHGAPVSVALIYLTVGRWLGLPLVAVTFPGRILIKYSDADGDVMLDPADGGMPLQEEDLALLFSQSYSMRNVPHYPLTRFLSTTDDKSLLVRMLRQLKQAYLLRGDAQRALWALEKIVMLVPGMASSFRERGYLYELLDCSIAAAEDYTRYIELMPDASDAELLRKRVPRLLQHHTTLH